MSKIHKTIPSASSRDVGTEKECRKMQLVYRVRSIKEPKVLMASHVQETPAIPGNRLCQMEHAVSVLNLQGLKMTKRYAELMTVHHCKRLLRLENATTVIHIQELKVIESNVQQMSARAEKS